MRIQAVLDRFEGDRAVLLVGDSEISVAWPRAALPEAAGEGDILLLLLDIDSEATRAAREEAEQLLRELREKN